MNECKPLAAGQEAAAAAAVEAERTRGFLHMLVALLVLVAAVLVARIVSPAITDVLHHAI